MAGWADSGSSRGRGGGGGGGGGFPNRGGANNMNTRWRARTPAQHQQQQHQQHQHHEHQQHQQQHQQQQRQHQQHQLSYRPVNGNDQSSQQHPPAEEPNRHRGQGGFSTSTRRPQPTRPPQARPISTDHKSPAPATNSDANANTSEPDDKARRNAANFECNVCFDMADDPVVTLCGHLFCWECLYQWLHVHSHHRECPVCKGQVANDAIIPIYGRGGSAASVHTAPPRPAGARVESSRQQQQQQQQAALDWHMVADDDDDSPIDELGRLRYHLSSLSAMMSFMPDLPVDSEEYDFDTPYYQSDFDQLYDITGFAAYATAGAGSSRRHGHHTGVSGDTMETIFESTNHREADLFYPGGHRQHGRARGAASPERYDIIDLPRGTRFDNGGRNSVSYRDTGAGPHNNNTGRSSRPNGGWTERRGRSNRNSNSGGGRGPHNNSRRQGANYN